jgi:hypothetical protein
MNSDRCTHDLSLAQKHQEQVSVLRRQKGRHKRPPSVVHAHEVAAVVPS